MATELPWYGWPTPPVPMSGAPCCTYGYGVALTVNLFVLVAVPPEVVIEITPVTAPGITRPTRLVPVLETTIAVSPPMLKAVGLPRLAPVTVTKVPTGPRAGANEVIDGDAANAVRTNTRQKISAGKIFDLISFKFSDRIRLKHDPENNH
jgi:hypothetical protein